MSLVLSVGEGGNYGDLLVKLSCFSHSVSLGPAGAYRRRKQKLRGHEFKAGSLGHSTCLSLDCHWYMSIFSEE